ncbi:MAG: helix-turn-helix domain-containing protein [Hyphomicrobiaceae bacterium]
MALEFPRIPKRLKPYVNRLIISEDVDHDPLLVQPWATGAIYLVYFYNDLSNYDVIVEGERHDLVHPAWMAGQLKFHKVDLHMKRHTAVVVAELKPQGFWQLFHQPGEWLTGRTCQMCDLADDVDVLANSTFLPVAENSNQALDRLISFFEHLVPAARSPDADVERMLRFIMARPEAFNIESASQKIGISRQTLTRRFTTIVGIGPKFYSRVAQVNRLVDLLVARKRMRLAILALQAGFYDQAHMTNVMKQFFSIGPNAFLRGDHETFLQFLQKLGEDVVEQSARN